ncbi:MAG: four-carbon acid sugar kinase family protein, partial [Mesorhizobium sp.]
MQNLLLSYYGDDLTGSTDVMEALELGGVATVLFMRQPDEALLLQFRHCRAIGLAGTSRSETPQWMDTHLKHAFTWLKTLNAEICHYKVCSTFDSSPTIGSIGRAIEIGRSVFSQDSVPLVVGAPQLKRINIVLLDVDSLETQALAGKEIWRVRRPGGTFVVGSSGIEYALLAEWASDGIVRAEPGFSPPGAADRIAVVSGSCSPTTERQIRHALTDGFDGIEVDPVELVSEASSDAIARAVFTGRASL